MKTTLEKAAPPAAVLAMVPHGVWLGVRGREFFLPHREFPCFRGMPPAAVRNVRLTRGGRLIWQDLDVELEVAALKEHERFPITPSTVMGRRH